MSKSSRSVEDIFPKETNIVKEKSQFLVDIDSKSQEEIQSSYQDLLSSYQKLLRVSTKITSLGDSAHSKMERMQEELQQTLDLLQLEKQRSTDLLHNILPVQIANRMQSNEHFIADKYDSVTVLFADIVDFTKIASDAPAKELVTMLNDVFSKFDDICKSLGVEKIKTIGDSYMAVAGMPDRYPDHAERAMELAIQMIETVHHHRQKLDGKLNIRIGLHSGDVVAGVIGKIKFAYDLWGDTVNIASRMESHGETGKIHVSEATYAILKDNYEFEYRGKTDIKGKGLMDTYFLSNRGFV